MSMKEGGFPSIVNRLLVFLVLYLSVLLFSTLCMMSMWAVAGADGDTIVILLTRNDIQFIMYVQGHCERRGGG